MKNSKQDYVNRREYHQAYKQRPEVKERHRILARHIRLRKREQKSVELMKQKREEWELKKLLEKEQFSGHACLCCGDQFSFIKVLGLEEIT